MQHTFSLRLPTELMHKVCEVAKAQDRSVNNTIKRLLEKALNDEADSK